MIFMTNPQSLKTLPECSNKKKTIIDFTYFKVSIALFSAALCKKDSKVLGILDTMGLTTKQQHRKTTLTFSMQDLVLPTS